MLLDRGENNPASDIRHTNLFFFFLLKVWHESSDKLILAERVVWAAELSFCITDSFIVVPLILFSSHPPILSGMCSVETSP